MHGADVLDTTSIFASIGAFQASPQLGFVVTVVSVGVAVVRRSPSLQEYLLGEQVPQGRAAQYFFKRPAGALPAPKFVEIPETPRIPTQPLYPAPKQVQVRPSAAQPVRGTPQARVNDWNIDICFGFDPQGAPVYAPVFHGAIVKSTGGGKTNLVDLIVGQLITAGVDVWVATPKYVPIDRTDGLERHRIYDAIPTNQKAIRFTQMDDWLTRAAREVEERYTRMQEYPGWFPAPMVVVLEELKAYNAMLKGKRQRDEGLSQDEATAHINTILTLGRECGVFLVFTSQDGYCGSVALTRGDMANLGFRLVHPSVDDNSKKNLALPDKLPSIAGMGPHAWYCVTGQDVRVVCVPRVSSQMLTDWGLLQQHTPAVTNTTQNLAPYAPKPADPWEDWTAQLMASVPEPTEPDHYKAVATAVKRGKATKALVLALVGGDEGEAFRALVTAGVSRNNIVVMWQENKATMLGRIAHAVGTAGTDE